MDLFCPFPLFLELYQKLSGRLNYGCSCCVCVKSVTSTSYLDEIYVIMKGGGGGNCASNFTDFSNCMILFLSTIIVTTEGNILACFVISLTSSVPSHQEERICSSIRSNSKMPLLT